MGLTPCLVDMPNEISSEKTKFSFVSDVNGRQLIVGGVCVHFPLSSGTPSVLKLIGPVHAPTVSEFICVSVLLYLEDTIFLDSSNTPGSPNLSFPHRFLSPEVRTLMKSSPLGLSVHSLPPSTHCWDVGLYVSSHLLQEASMMMAEWCADLCMEHNKYH